MKKSKSKRKYVQSDTKILVGCRATYIGKEFPERNGWTVDVLKRCHEFKTIFEIRFIKDGFEHECHNRFLKKIIPKDRALISEIKRLDQKRKAGTLTAAEDKQYARLNSQHTGLPNKVFTSQFDKKLTDAIARTDAFLKTLKNRR